MSVVDPADLPEECPVARAKALETLRRVINRCDPWFRALGFAWLTPIWRLLAEDNPRAQVKELWRLAVVPLLSITAFLMLQGNRVWPKGWLTD